MNQLSKVIKIGFLITLVTLIPGCGDKSDVERKAFVIGIGLDPGDEKGKINVTYLIANAEVGTAIGGSITDEDPDETITVSASDFISSKNTANSIIAREIAYDLLNVIFVSEELAKRDEFLRYIYSAMKDREIKRNTYLVVTKESVQDYLKKNKPKMETRPHKFYEFMIERGIETGLIPPSELHHFFRITEEDANSFLAIYTTTEDAEEQEHKENEIDYLAGEIKVEGETNTTQFIGSAVFLEGKMIGTLTGQDTRIVMVLHQGDTVPDVLTTFNDPFSETHQIAVRLHNLEKSKVRMNLDKSNPRIDVTVPFSVDVLSDYSMSNFADDPAKIEKLRKSLEKQMEVKILEVVRKTQEEFKAETFGWSLIARKQFKTLDKYMEFNWFETYPKMDVHVKVDIEFREFGRQPELPGYKGIRD